MRTNLTKSFACILMAIQVFTLILLGSVCYGQTHFQRSVVRVDNLNPSFSVPIDIPLPADCHDARIGVRLFYSGENNNATNWGYTANFTLSAQTGNPPCINQVDCPSEGTSLSLEQVWNATNNVPTKQTFIAGKLFDFKYKKSDFEPDPTTGLPRFLPLTLSGTGGGGLTTPPGIYAEVEVYTTSLAPLNPTTQFNFSKKELQNNEKVLLFWDYVEGAVSYELEWTYLDSYTTLPNYGVEIGSMDIAQLEALPLTLPFQEKEPVRVVTNNQHFELPLTYPSGFLFYRVRPIGYYDVAELSQNMLADAPKERLVGAWQYGTVNGVKKHLMTKLATDFEEDKLWQVVTTFAEEGKFKKVVSYLDGSSRNRQTVTHSNSDATVLVAEQFYNYEGAANVQILPTPLIGSGLHYHADVNFFTDANGAKTRDKSSYDGTIARLHKDFGAARYYSSNNPFLNSTNKLHSWYSQYTPDADGFVASQSRMLNDNTNRLQVQGGVGKTFQIHDDASSPDCHDTRYYYGTAVGNELKRLFGHERVGNPQHYRKTLVKDANGQVSLSYTNQEGKTIATALAQASPKNLEKLVWNYPEGQQYVIVDLNEYSKTIDGGSRYVTQFNLLNADASTTYGLAYTVSLRSCQTCPVICNDCAYTIKFKIIDQNTQELVFPERSLDMGPQNCETGFNPVTWDFQLPVGSYTIYKEVFVKGKTWDDLRADVLNPNTTYGREYQQELQRLTNAHQTLLNQTDDCRWEYPGSVYLEQVLKEQVLTKCQMGTGAAIAPSDPRYCEYLACMALADANVFVQQLYLINTWAEAELAFGNSLDKTFYQKDPLFQDASYGLPYQVDMEKLLGALSVNANKPPVSIETFMANSTLDNTQKWTLFRRIYLQARQIVYERSLKNTKTAANNFQGCTTISSTQSATLEDRYWAWRQANGDVFFSNNPTLIANSFADFINQQNPAVSANDLVPYLTDFYSNLDSYKNPWRLLYTDDNDVNLLEIKNILVAANSSPMLLNMLMPDLAAYQNLPQFFELLQPAKKVLIGKGITDSNTLAEIANNPLMRHDALLTARPSGELNHPEFAVEFVLDHLRVPMPFKNNDSEFDYEQAVPLLSRRFVGGYETTLFNGKKIQLPFYFTLGVKNVLKPAMTVSIPNPTGTSPTTIDKTEPAKWQYQLFAQPFWLSPQAWETARTLVSAEELACMKGLVVNFNLPNGLQPCDHIRVVFEQVSERLDNQLTIRLKAFTVYVNGQSLGTTQLNWKTGTGSGGIGHEKTEQEQGVEGSPRDYPLYEDPIEPPRGGDPTCYGKIPNGFFFEARAEWAWGGTWVTDVSNSANYRTNTFAGAVHSIALTKMEVGSTKHTIAQRYEAINGSLENQAGGSLVIPADPAVYEWLPSQCIASPQMALPYLKEIGQDLTPQNLSGICLNRRSNLLQAQYEEDKAALLINFMNKARLNANACIANFTRYRLELFQLSYIPKEYHYTLYYYDQAQNLTATVPPAGVVPDGTGVSHTLMTHYAFNTLNQPLKQKSPDGGETVFYYDKLTRLRLSQNAKQKAESANTGEFIGSYTQYDAIGRTIETGQLRYTGTDIAAYLAKNITKPEFPVNDIELRTEQLTHTVYDEQGEDLGITQTRYSRNRISSTYTQAFFNGNPNAVDTKTAYCYDVHGNVKELKQFIQAANATKSVEYEYDLISGKVNKVYFQKGATDMFIHCYRYDADNRLMQVETSVDDWFFATDASYFYYPHGPLARIELGHYKIQGLDYAYTLQGWLKGVNSLNDGVTTHLPINDMGGDGNEKAEQIHHQKVGKDVFGFTLHYFKEDYMPVGLNANNPLSSDIFNENTQVMYNNGNVTSLYNGNIAAMRTAIHIKDDNNNPKISENSMQQLMAYNYDQLNRITRTRNIELESGKFQITKKYKENYSYDPNGNILTLNRTNGQGETFDFLSYNYDISLNNQLRQVTDEGGDTNAASNDFDNYERYEYDEIGNLIYLEGNGETSRMTWTIYGKLETVVKENQATNILTTVTYLYNAMGNRVHKSVVKEDNSGNMSSSSRGKYQTTYWRDAQGNVLKTETSGFSADLNGVQTSKNSEEFVIYGSSRLGTYSPVYNEYVSQFFGITANSLTLGYKAYELSNHLGNVLTTISDNYFVAPPSGAGGLARVLHSQDYLPFGMAMTNRGYTEIGGSGYAFGFNTQRKDLDIDENGNHYTAEFWEYDGRIGRRWNIDPVVKVWESGYACFFNCPILFNDPSGDIPPKAFYDSRSNTLILFKPTQAQVKALIYGSTMAYAGHAGPLEDVEKRFGQNLVRNTFINININASCESGVPVVAGDNIDDVDTQKRLTNNSNNINLLILNTDEMVESFLATHASIRGLAKTPHADMDAMKEYYYTTYKGAGLTARVSVKELEDWGLDDEAFNEILLDQYNAVASTYKLPTIKNLKDTPLEVQRRIMQYVKNSLSEIDEAEDLASKRLQGKHLITDGREINKTILEKKKDANVVSGDRGIVTTTEIRKD